MKVETIVRPALCCALFRASYISQVLSAFKEITFDNESRRKMQIGINKLADAVGVTLGPRGEPTQALYFEFTGGSHDK